MRDFRTLAIWRRSHLLCVALYRASREMRRAGAASLTSQLVRAAESVVLNIVEGAAADSDREFARFLQMSIRSTSEVEAQLQLARSYGLLDRRRWRIASEEIVEIRRMTCAFRRKLLEDDAQARKRDEKQPPGRPRRDRPTR